MSSEALITVTYETRFTKLESRGIAYIDIYKYPDTIAEQFEKEADRCIEYVSDVLEHKYGRRGVNEPPAIKRRISNRQKVQLVQEIIDNANLPYKQAVELIREALKR